MGSGTATDLGTKNAGAAPVSLQTTANCPEALSSIGADGSSGLDNCMKFRFGLASIVMWTSVVVTSGMRSVYVVVFGGPATELGVVFTVISVAYPFFVGLAAYLYKNEVVTWAFPVETWGRYAGLMSLATVLLAGAVMGIFLPVTRDDLGMCLWVGLMFSFATFAQAVINLGMHAAEVEVFPFQKERLEITMWVIISVVIGCVVSVSCTLLVTASPSLTVRITCGIICSVMAMTAMALCCAPYTRARQPRGVITSFWEDNKAAWRIDAFRWIVIAISLDGSAFAINIFWLLYFLFYNLNMYSDEATFWFGAVLAGSIITTAVIAPFASHVFTKEDSCVDLQQCAAVTTLVKPVLWLSVMTWANSGGVIIIAYMLIAAVGVPSTFYQSVAKAWIIDEDAHSTGVRRESSLQGAMGAVQWLCINSLPVILLIIFGVLGFSAADCTAFDSGTDQQKACEKASDESQPEIVEEFIYWVQIVPCTIFWTGAAYCYSKFPIRGERLKKLTDNQALAFKKIDGPNQRSLADGTGASTGLEVVTESDGLDTPSKVDEVDAKEETKRDGQL